MIIDQNKRFNGALKLDNYGTFSEEKKVWSIWNLNY